MLVLKNTGQKNVRSKNFGSKKFRSEKLFGPKKFGWNKIFVQYNLGPQKVKPKKFVEHFVSNSWDIPDMDKCRQEKCCLDKCQHDSWNQFKMVPGIYFLSWVILGQ